MAHFFSALQVSKQLYRSPQPDFEDLLALKERGISAVVNLREEATESEFFSRQCGMKYLYLPVVDWATPATEQIASFLQFLGVNENLPVLVHCAAGIGRTGTFVACYRIANGMPLEDALRLTNAESPLPGITMNAIQKNFVREFRP